MKKYKDKIKAGSTPLKNPKHELFCHLYAGHHNANLFGNGTQCYALAYGYADKISLNLEVVEEMQTKKPQGFSAKVAAMAAANKRMKNVAAVDANRLLISAKIIERVNHLMDQLISHDLMDRELAYVASQRDDMNSKVAAIKEYNRLKTRVSDKLEGEFTFKWDDGQPGKPIKK